MPVAFTSLSLSSAVAACFGLATSFVISLYLADVGLPRDHPTTIKRRVFVISMVTLLSPWSLLLLADTVSLDVTSLLHTLGLKTDGLITAVIYPSLLVFSLYFGYILQRATHHDEEDEGILAQLRSERWDILLRNFVVAPIVEEIVFRSCMVPLLLPHLGPHWTIFVCPLFFGVAHIHHMFDHLRSGSMTVTQALFNVLLQTCYTSLFGMFSAHLFIRTGHVISAIVAHTLCNILGLPDIFDVPQHRHPILVGGTYILGFGTFLYLLTSRIFYPL